MTTGRIHFSTIFCFNLEISICEDIDELIRYGLTNLAVTSATAEHEVQGFIIGLDVVLLSFPIWTFSVHLWDSGGKCREETGISDILNIYKATTDAYGRL